MDLEILKDVLRIDLVFVYSSFLFLLGKNGFMLGLCFFLFVEKNGTVKEMRSENIVVGGIKRNFLKIVCKDINRYFFFIDYLNFIFYLD